LSNDCSSQYDSYGFKQIKGVFMKARLITVVTFCFLALVVGHAQAGIVEKEISLPNGLGTATLYSNEQKGPATSGVIVVHEWWGLNQFVNDRAKKLAEEGYTAIAVDIYGHGKVADHPKDAKSFKMKALSEPNKINARFNAAKKILLKQSTVDAKRVFALGYCFGGAVVLNQARMGNDLAGVASFHGSLSSSIKANKGDIQAKILVAHGGSDPMVPVEQATGFIQEMLTLGVDVKFLNYPEAKHAFTNPAATEKGQKYKLPLEYNEHAATDSWAAFMDFIAD
jgi:dienelactone hydrolase